MQTIESQYRLSYPPQLLADGKFHEIKVEAFVLDGDWRQEF